jgi:hypothetical protein
MIKTDAGSGAASRTRAVDRRIASIAFVAGFISTLVFHQLMLAVLHGLGMTPAIPYRFQPVPPFAVPQVISSAFWGGIWGIVFAFAERRGLFPQKVGSGGYWVAAFAFGALALTLVAWFVVSPLKGRPVAAGWQPVAMVTGLLVNGAWGIGTALLLRLLDGRSTR